jgi:hypothetical protein
MDCEGAKTCFKGQCCTDHARCHIRQEFRHAEGEKQVDADYQKYKKLPGNEAICTIDDTEATMQEKITSIKDLIAQRRQWDNKYLTNECQESGFCLPNKSGLGSCHQAAIPTLLSKIEDCKAEILRARQRAIQRELTEQRDASAREAAAAKHAENQRRKLESEQAKEASDKAEQYALSAAQRRQLENIKSGKTTLTDPEVEELIRMAWGGRRDDLLISDMSPSETVKFIERLNIFLVKSGTFADPEPGNIVEQLKLDKTDPTEHGLHPFATDKKKALFAPSVLAQAVEEKKRRTKANRQKNAAAAAAAASSSSRRGASSSSRRGGKNTYKVKTNKRQKNRLIKKSKRNSRNFSITRRRNPVNNKNYIKRKTRKYLK